MSKFLAFRNLWLLSLLLPGAGFSQGSDCAEDGAAEFICGVPSAEDLIRIGDSDLVIAGGMGRPDWSFGGFRIIDVNTRAHYEPEPDYSSPSDELSSGGGVQAPPLGTQLPSGVAVPEIPRLGGARSKNKS